MIRLAPAVVLLLALVSAAAAAKPRPPGVDPSCTTAAERRAAIRFRASDGASLVGLLLGPARARAGVVLSHESDGGVCSWLTYGRRLARLGYRVLVYDSRGYGSSPLPRRRPTRYELDVAGAAAELRRRGARAVVLAGGSMGAMSSLVAGAGAGVRPAVAGVVAVSPALSFRGLTPLRHVPALRVPVLYVVAQDDGEFPAHARALHDATGSSDKRLVTVAGSGHGRALLYGREAAPVRARIEAFVREHTR